ncbi:ogr/Delta-like zinc finger family protein [Enterobacter hormaechei]|uniref:ogr/Delta-like zinc finger family protein n=1 Tax=Enterobacter hormaechei TaxID=158836 RepID=UPI000F86997F|nr:ogr/Delta-like zinc finger family protein [Enterobacter hormaechei]RTO99734.1 hypothetical protein EKN57_17480 [Enterobacter hormaechei]
MFRCPKCGASTRTRSSTPFSCNTKISYHQCNNLMCSSTFTTTTEFDRFISEGKLNPDAPPIPVDSFPASHTGSNQMELAI